MKKSRNLARLHRKRRVLVRGTKKKPRLVVFRSLRVIYAGLVDDVAGKVLLGVDSRKVDGKKYDKDSAFKTGELIAQKAAEQKITKVVFDRGGYKYHGKVKALAEGARKGGLKF
jgi:large subunit ribosomal protein L18